jgi:hypothetical protein
MGVFNNSSTAGSCALHRLDSNGNIISSNVQTVAPNASTINFGEPSGSGANYALECFMPAGAGIISYFLNASS